MKRKEIIFLLIIVVISILSYFVFLRPKEGTGELGYIITIDGKEYKVDTLSNDDEFVIQTELGYNSIVIDEGFIFVNEADCNDNTCVNKGMVGLVGETIICLPHKLCITVIEH